MNSRDYAECRRKLGTQKDVAELLGVSIKTIKNRERPSAEISTEASIAMRASLKFLLMFPGPSALGKAHLKGDAPI
jgi:DNA-binding XRE family transcriptional regulator